MEHTERNVTEKEKRVIGRHIICPYLHCTRHVFSKRATCFTARFIRLGSPKHKKMRKKLLTFFFLKCIHSFSISFLQHNVHSIESHIILCDEIINRIMWLSFLVTCSCRRSQFFSFAWLTLFLLVQNHLSGFMLLSKYGKWACWWKIAEMFLTLFFLPL